MNLLFGPLCIPVDDCKTRKDTKQSAQQNMEQTQNPHNGSNNKQHINNSRATALEQTAA